jgi:hypothetical protein
LYNLKILIFGNNFNQEIQALTTLCNLEKIIFGNEKLVFITLAFFFV